MKTPILFLVVTICLSCFSPAWGQGEKAGSPTIIPKTAELQPLDAKWWEQANKKFDEWDRKMKEQAGPMAGNRPWPISPPPPPVSSGPFSPVVIIAFSILFFVALFCLYEFFNNFYKPAVAEDVSALGPPGSSPESASVPEPHLTVQEEPPPPKPPNKFKAFIKDNPQKAALIAGVCLIILMTLCPPWNWHKYHIRTERTGLYGQSQHEERYYYETFSGYHWIFAPPQGGTYLDTDEIGRPVKVVETPEIYWGLLILQYLAVALAGGGAYYFFRETLPGLSLQAPQ